MARLLISGAAGKMSFYYWPLIVHVRKVYLYIFRSTCLIRPVSVSVRPSYVCPQKVFVDLNKILVFW